jgi:hypothetical protein
MKKIASLLLAIVALISSCSKNSDNDLYSYSLLPVKSEEKWGYIDGAGKYVINPQFKEAYLFSDNLGLVKSQDDKYGYIGEDGKFIINPVYKYATSFSEGLAFVTPENGFPTCIDKHGETKFVLTDVESVCILNEGLAAVCIKDKWGFIDNTGKIIINPQFDAFNDFSEGLGTFGMKKEIGSDDIEWGYIDKEGKITINAQFKRAGQFKDGKAVVGDGKKYGYIDKKGLYIINPQFDDANSFSDGLAAIKQGETWGFINADGKIVINPQFEEVSNFKNGLAAVKIGKENWGYIDKEGKFVINPQFKLASRFYSDLAPVLSGEKFGFIDKQGKFTINPQFTDVFSYSDWTKTFVEWQNRENTKSDYFDVIDIIANILKKGNEAELTFSEVNSQTNLQRLVNMKEYKDKLKKNDSYSAIKINKEKLSDDAEIKSTIFFFNESIMKTTYSFFSSREELNYSSNIESVVYNIELNKYGKGFGKANVLAEALQKELLKKYKGSESNTETEEQNGDQDYPTGMEKALMEERAKAVADSIAAAITASMNEGTSTSKKDNEVKGESKTYYVYSKSFTFIIKTDGENELTFRVFFPTKTNS